jgi:hypothetical protein
MTAYRNHTKSELGVLGISSPFPEGPILAEDCLLALPDGGLLRAQIV